MFIGQTPSYWRGQVFDRFDGRSWHSAGSLSPTGTETKLSGSSDRYTQTFYIQHPEPGTNFMGYRGVELLSAEDTLYRESLGNEYSYKVVSVRPELVPEKLRQDRAARTGGQYRGLPTSMGWLPGVADRITAGASSDFDKAASIVNFLRHNGEYDDSATNQLSSSSSLDGFLLRGEPGTSMDFATSAVMLARAAGLPARLAVGYLPGEQDLLSGAYTVRERDAHAWADVLFQEHGWVPFDGTHRPDGYAAASGVGGQIPGLKYLFESSVGDDLLRAAVLAPSKLSSGIAGAFNSPASAGMAIVAVGVILFGLGWLGIRVMWRRRRQRDVTWLYFRLPVTHGERYCGPMVSCKSS